MKLKSECCDKIHRKGKACKRCPLVAGMSKKKRRKHLKRIRKNLDKAA